MQEIYILLCKSLSIALCLCISLSLSVSLIIKSPLSELFYCVEVTFRITEGVYFLLLKDFLGKTSKHRTKGNGQIQYKSVLVFCEFWLF